MSPEIAAAVKRIVDEAPKLSPEVRDRLAILLLRGGGANEPV